VLPRDTSKYAFFADLSFLPDGKHFLYSAGNISSPGDVYFASISGKENRMILEHAGNALYASGFLLYPRGTALMAQPFDSEKGKFTAAAVPVIDQIQRGEFDTFFDASQNGVLIYEPGDRAPRITQLAWFDRAGKRLAIVGKPAIHYDLRLSPDGRKLASSIGDPKSEIWIDDLSRGVRMRLTFDPDTDHGIPVWSRDSSALLFSTVRGSKAGVGIFRKASSGAGAEELLLASDRPDGEAWATDLAPDGRFLLFSRGNMLRPNFESEIWVLPLDNNAKPIPFLHATSAYDAQFSPNGKWVAYTSGETGKPEVYVAPFEPAKLLSRMSGTLTGKWQISTDGGRTPRWRRDSKELFYISEDDAITAVEVEGKGANFEVGRSQRLFMAPLSAFSATYDVAPDGQRFIMSTFSDQEIPPPVLMLNWTARLQAK
jgi:Tol biopolymer transport system component